MCATEALSRNLEPRNVSKIPYRWDSIQAFLVGSMWKLIEHEYQVDIGRDGNYYCRIYQYGVPGAIASTDDYDTEEEAIEAAEEIIRGLYLKTDEA